MGDSVKVAADVLALVARSGGPALRRGRGHRDGARRCAGTKSSWRASDLARAINDALPDYLRGLDGRQVQQLVDGLAHEAIQRHGVA